MSRLIIFTAPSGAGKTTIVKHLLSHFSELAFSVSAATRKRRAHEKDGQDYYFISSPLFKSLIEKDAFVEWEEVYEDQFYGTLRAELYRLWALGKVIIFDIDVIGALNLKRAYPESSVAVFVEPPSTQALKDRLKSRNTEDEKSLNKRISKAEKELKFKNQFDHILLNDDLEIALKDAETLISAFLEPSNSEKV